MMVEENKLETMKQTCKRLANRKKKIYEENGDKYFLGKAHAYAIVADMIDLPSKETRNKNE